MGSQKVLSRKAPLTLTLMELKLAAKRRAPASPSTHTSKRVESWARGNCRCSASPWFISMSGAGMSSALARRASMAGAGGFATTGAAGSATRDGAFPFWAPFLCCIRGLRLPT
jgi:hypothetical protein